MRTILICTYYGLRESLRLAADQLEKLGWQVEDHPLFLDTNLDAKIRLTNPDVILFWSYNIDPSYLKQIKANFNDKKFVIFNWDDPFSWSWSNIKQIAGIFDLALTSCQEATKWYLERGARQSEFLLPGFTPAPLEVDKRYICDVAICITNLYENNNVYPNQKINRKKLIDLLVASGLDFRIYGPGDLKEIYPNHYHGFVNYSDLPKVFYNTKINICTHVDSRYKYTNERSILITGSSGLLLVDPIHDYDQIFNPGQECLQLDLDDPISQIKTILAHYDEYANIKEKGYNKALTNYTWADWAAKVNKLI